MQEITFSLRTITPLFLAGADPAGDHTSPAELRAPSFRGPMRYWYRALIGGIVGTETVGLKQVIEAESSLFGATDTGSAVLLRVSPPSHEPKEFTEQISHKDSSGQWQATGKGYLLWSMARSGSPKKGNVKPARWYFPPGTRFQVTLTSRGKNTDQLEQAASAFWLLTQLGSLGSRARRCAGSLAIQEIQPNFPTYEPLPFAQPANAQALQQQLEKGLQSARKLYIHNAQSPQIRQASFDILSRGVCRIWILQDEQPWPSAEIAMTMLGERLQNYRGQINIYQRRIFGLPLSPLFMKERRSSPLLLRITELQGNKYVGIAVLFKTSGRDVRIEDYALIERWVTNFKGRLEVTL